MTQMTFDDLLNAPPICISRPKSLAADSPRLNAQCQAILERLRKGRASNQELSSMALNYTARISELRNAGYLIPCVDRNRETGLSWYELGGRKS